MTRGWWTGLVVAILASAGTSALLGLVMHGVGGLVGAVSGGLYGLWFPRIFARGMEATS